MSDDYPTLFREFWKGSDAFSLLTQSPVGSEPMSLVQLFIPTEVAHDAVAELGELGNVEFKDVSTNF